MTSIASRVAVCVSAIGLMACTSEPLPMTSGHTTTTYGNTNGDSDDGDPVDVTDDGPEPTDDGPDPSDDGPDPSDDGDDDPWGSGPGPLDFGNHPDLGGPDGAPDGSTCTADSECSSGNCYVIPFLGGTCGQCNEDADCDGGGCSPPNPFEATPPYCNMGELGAGCESDEVCAPGLSCSTALDLLGLIQLNSCGECESDPDCGGLSCAPIVDIGAWSGQNVCVEPNSLPQDTYCNLEGNGDEVCASGICSVVDVMGLAQIGSCGECNVDADCGDGGICQAGEFILDTAVLLGSTCQ
jgi:hypothetical protein